MREHPEQFEPFVVEDDSYDSYDDYCQYYIITSYIVHVNTNIMTALTLYTHLSGYWFEI